MKLILFSLISFFLLVIYWLMMENRRIKRIHQRTMKVLQAYLASLEENQEVSRHKTMLIKDLDQSFSEYKTEMNTKMYELQYSLLERLFKENSKR